MTRLPWGTETALLLNQVGWLSVNQLSAYHKLVSYYKIDRDEKPAYLSEKFKKNFLYNTRQKATNCLQVSITPKSGTSCDSFVHSTTMLWNTLPVNLRKAASLQKFKTALKSWVKQNIPV